MASGGSFASFPALIAIFILPIVFVSIARPKYLQRQALPGTG
jgi:hypothetical protein